MREHRCGFIPVMDDGVPSRLVGVVTDRDLALHLARMDHPASQLPVAGCMTREPSTVTPDAELEDAARIMEAHGIHRLPVVGGGRLVGVLSVKDIARAAKREWASAGPHIAERQLAEILEAIATAQ